jgi:putative ABC transport system permease protein
MGPVLKTARGISGRHAVQSLVILVVVGIATASGVVGLTLATNANLSYKTATATRRTPDLAVLLNATKVTASELARTRHLKGVTEAAGPYAATTIQLAARSGGAPSPAFTVVARASQLGPLDNLVCFTSPPGLTHCGWPKQVGQIEIASYAPVQLAANGGRLGQVGIKAKVTSLGSKPTLTVAGYAVSLLEDAEGWATPAEISALQRAGAPRLEQMLYTFADASTSAEINADLAELKTALPAGAIKSSQNLVTHVGLTRSQTSQKPPYTEAYAVIILLLALIVAATVVASAVNAGYRRIGVLKSIGFTPAQVVATYLAQLALPAAVGALVGAVLGADWAVPLINGGPYHVHVDAPLWIDLTAAAGVCALVAGAGFIPAMRAARLTAIGAIAAGTSPKSTRGTRFGSAARGLTGRMRLPRPVTIGVGSAFSRPSSAVAVAAVFAVGLAATVMAIGLDSQMMNLVLGASLPNDGGIVSGKALVHRFTLLVAIVAGLGLLSATLLLTRQRVRDLGVYKALGMTPRQLIATIVCWVLAPALAAAVIALPLGIVLEQAVAQATVDAQTGPLGSGPARGVVHGPPSALRARGSVGPGHQVEILRRRQGHTTINLAPGARAGAFAGSSGGVGMPDAYNPGTLILIVLAGLGVATVGALGPAAWAASSRSATVIRVE